MPSYSKHDDLSSLPSSSHFLSPSIQNRRSSAALRTPSTLVQPILDDQHHSPSRQAHSLAHELAAALMPEPSAGSKLLAEEFGIEYDEGAEGIDSDLADHHDPTTQFRAPDDDPVPSFAQELNSASSFDDSFQSTPSEIELSLPPEFDPAFRSPTPSRKNTQPKKPEQDPMEILAQDLQSTDKFLAHLRSIDIESTGSSTSAAHQPNVERVAVDFLSRINEAVRDREGQVRELLEYEREFRKIAGEMGGTDVLSSIDELDTVQEEYIPKSSSSTKPNPSRSDNTPRLKPIEELQPPNTHQTIHDWELDPDISHLGDADNDDGDEDTDFVASPRKESFPAPPPIDGPATPAQAIIQLAHMRSFTTSVVSSLTTISEQAQVNGAATADAGRKIRALKNKLGGWRTEWDSAERSRIKIERWEAGVVDSEAGDGATTPVTPSKLTMSKRIDGRKVVQEHLHAFELALADAAVKTQAIMAR
ncbi:hypothetical protein BDQ17DRAFT_1352583 [Cyathus striatus]|nr:hypothetical protein BDQ17DRAFT_1352583 [Cyathus striatus]